MSSLAGMAKKLATVLPANTVRRISKMTDGIEQAGVYGIMGKEIIGINAPKMLKIRNMDEFVDSAISELGNTAGYFGSGYLITKLTETLIPKLTKTNIPNLAANKMYDVGQSILLCMVPGSILYAMPFIRNYITGKRTGTTGFTDMVGHMSFAKQPKTEYKSDMKRFKRTALAVLGIGAALGVGGFAYCKRLALKGVKIADKPLAKFWNKNFLFEEGKFKKMPDSVGLFFWGLPAYAGWIHASRQWEERAEQTVKMLNFFAMFYFLPKAVQSWLKSPKNYDKGFLTALKTHTLKGAKKAGVNFNSKKQVTQLMTELGYSAAKKSTVLKTRGVHKAVAYLSSVVGLFVSNWIANSLAIDLTAKLAKKEQKKYGKIFIEKFNSNPDGWQSPTFPSFAANAGVASRNM